MNNHCRCFFFFLNNRDVHLAETTAASYVETKKVTYSSKREGPCVEVCGNRLRTCLGDQLN